MSIPVCVVLSADNQSTILTEIEIITWLLDGLTIRLLTCFLGYYSVRLVERDAQKASLYGRVTLFGSDSSDTHHVAFLVKSETEPGKLAVAVKSDNAELASALVSELDSVRAMLSAKQ